MEICDDTVSSLEKSPLKKELFDLTNVSKGLSVTNNKVLCLPNNNKSEHKFVFANIDLPSSPDKDVEWKIILNNPTSWLGLGICIKDTVLANKMRFVGKEASFCHAFFGISSNGYSWNCHNTTENNTYVNNFPSLIKGDVITFRYSSEMKELHYKISNKFSGKLTHVYAPKGSSLSPSMIFLNPGDEIMLETN